MKTIRYNPKINYGLTKEQVEERYRTNLFNRDTTVKTKTIPQIIITSTFTLFNLLNIFLATCIILVGEYKNVLFLGVIVCNTVIGIIQEIKAKKVIDKLNLLSESKVKVLREGKQIEISHEEIVLDDLIILTSGDQVVIDSVIVSGECEINESAVTGEEKSILKKENDEILSGSFIVSGYIVAKVNHVAEDNYISVISKDAKKIKRNKSEIIRSLNKIIKVISFIIVPLGAVFFYIQYNLSGNTLANAVVNTVAALLIMIPDGLILLISTVFAIGVVRISKNKILVQNLYCSENLARVDVMCLDKTGTITEGIMEVKDIIPLSNTSKEEQEKILNDICYFSKDNNSVMQAIKSKYNKTSNLVAKKVVPFSSKQKYSGITFRGNGTYILGAPEFVMKENYSKIQSQVERYVENNRVLLIAYSKNEFISNDLPDNIEPLGLILLQDKIRSDAIKTIEYFKKQGVDLKIISGDNPKTVASIAKRSGFGEINFIDASKIESDEELRKKVRECNIFGRVSPFQKKKIVKFLQEDKHVVAFTGDGVNDVLALKQSDCSITIANASEAARNVSELILLDSDFSKMPYVVADGRKNINNLERSAVLFLTKTVYASILAIIFLFVDEFYPFIPIQTSLISVTTIGIPSFILALEKNEDLVQGKFLINVLKKVLPGALTVVFNIIIILILKELLNLTQEEVSTFSVILTSFTGFMVIYKLCVPFNLLRTVLLIVLISLFTSSYLLFPSLFSMTYLSYKNVILLIILILFDIIIYSLINIITYKIFNKNKNELLR